MDLEGYETWECVLLLQRVWLWKDLGTSEQPGLQREFASCQGS